MAKRRTDGTFEKGESGNPRGRLKIPAQPIPDNAIIPGNYDGFASFTTGIGTQMWDKRLSHFHVPAVLTYQQQIELWATSDLSRVAIEGPIEDAYRQGWELSIGDPGDFTSFIDDVMEDVERIKLDHVMERAFSMERALGGSAVLVGANDGRPLSAPLDPSKANGVNWLTLLEPIELTPFTYVKDANSPDYGEPELYMLTGFTTAGAVGVGGAGTALMGERAPPPETLIHASRLIIFAGIRVSRYQFAMNPSGRMWGESILTSTYEAQRDVEVAFHAAGIMATDAGQPAISMDNLMGLIAKDPKAVKVRMLALQNMRSTARVILLDTNEKLERQGTEHLNGIPDLLACLMGRYAASIPMPVSRMLGASPKTIGTDTADEIRFYYDSVRARQVKKIRPKYRPILKMIMQANRKRKLPKRWLQKFRDLTQLTDAEAAEARLTQARADLMYIKGGVATSDEIRKARFFGGYSFETELNEKKEAPGFVAPPPPGTPGSPQSLAGKPVGPNAHAVTGYTRKNPDPNVAPAPKQGGDGTPGDGPNAKKDEDGPGRAVIFAGLSVIVESPRGSVRYWTDTDGTEGQTIMKYDYGYIDNAVGADGDCVDMYLGPDEAAKWVYVVHQNKKPDFQDYDEDKVLLGFPSADAAKAAYEDQYDDQGFFGGMSQMTLQAFKDKITQGAGKVTNESGY